MIMAKKNSIYGGSGNTDRYKWYQGPPAFALFADSAATIPSSWPCSELSGSLAEGLGNAVGDHRGNASPDARKNADPSAYAGGANDIEEVLLPFVEFRKDSLSFAHFDADPFLVNLQGVFDDLAHDEYAKEDGKEVESIPHGIETEGET